MAASLRWLARALVIPKAPRTPADHYPHQGAAEKARRVKQAAKKAKKDTRLSNG